MRHAPILLITINDGLRISGVLPAASLSTAYSATLTGYGGIEPYTWFLSSGALPDGITATQDSNGDFVFSGTPTEAGSFEITVTLRDSEGRSTSRSFKFRVNALPLTITGSAPDGAVGDPYSYTYDVAGGIPPYFPYLIVGGGFGPLPSGLTLTQDSNGDVVITGTPDFGSGGTYTFKIGVDDSQIPAAFAYVINTITIGVLPLVVTGTFLDTEIGDPLEGSPLPITGGVPPYSLSGSPYSGTRPAGVSIAVVGTDVVATGNTTTATSYSWTERVLDSLGSHFDVVSTVDVEYPTLVVTGTFTDADQGDPLGGTPLPITGGDGTYGLSGSPYSGTRPPGPSFSIVGTDLVASGNTTTAGSYTWTERVTSGDGQHFDVVSTADIAAVGMPPDTYGGLTYWFDADDISTLFQDQAGTTPVTTTGQTIRNAKDANGGALSMNAPGTTNLYDDNGATATNATIYLAGSAPINGSAAGSNFITAAAFTITCNVKVSAAPSANSPTQNKIFGASSGSTPQWILHAYNTSGSTIDFIGSNRTSITTHSVTNTVASALSSWVVVSIRHTGGNIQIRVNGGSWTTLASGNTGGTPLASSPGFGGSNGMISDVNNLACYNVGLSDADLLEVEKWLGARCGVTI